MIRAASAEIEWTILGDIPNYDSIDGYKLVDPLDEQVPRAPLVVLLLGRA